jgi:hypothetical protein
MSTVDPKKKWYLDTLCMARGIVDKIFAEETPGACYVEKTKLQRLEEMLRYEKSLLKMYRAKSPVKNEDVEYTEQRIRNLQSEYDAELEKAKN